MPVLVRAPMDGTVLALSDVPDEAFAAGYVGDGAAIDPGAVTSQAVHAPVDGTVVSAHPHGFVVETADGRAVLVHLGLDTVGLREAPFTLHAEVGATVRCGDLVVTWSPAAVVRAGFSPLCPVVALRGTHGEAPTPLIDPGQPVLTGQPLLAWA